MLSTDISKSDAFSDRRYIFRKRRSGGISALTIAPRRLLSVAMTASRNKKRNSRRDSAMLYVTKYFTKSVNGALE